MSKLPIAAMASTVAFWLLAAPAWAYLDPGTGSYVFQMVVATVISVGFLVRTYWHRLRAFFTRREPPRPPGPPDAG